MCSLRHSPLDMHGALHRGYQVQIVFDLHMASFRFLNCSVRDLDALMDFEQDGFGQVAV
jgi:hypothetical protein